jgi:hypothetical protein
MPGSNGADLRLEAGEPARKIVLPVNAIDAERFGVGELLDIAETLGTDLAGLAQAMRSPGVHQTRMLVAIAWILVRRLEPEVTFADAARWRITVDAQPDPTPGVAQAAPEIEGLSPT